MFQLYDFKNYTSNSLYKSLSDHIPPGTLTRLRPSLSITHLESGTSFIMSAGVISPEGGKLNFLKNSFTTFSSL